MKDYYSILGIKKSLSISEIKKAFRRNALKYHPDKNSDKNSSERFKDVYEAYEVLSNEENRKEYDILYKPFNEENSKTEYQNSINKFNENINQTRKRAVHFSNLNYEELLIYFRIVFKNSPDLLLTTFVLIIGLFMSIVPFSMGELSLILIGLIIGIPLIIVSIRDYSLIFKIKDKKEQLSNLIRVT